MAVSDEAGFPFSEVSPLADAVLPAGASTVPEARKQGAQIALLDGRLRYAAEQGCDIAMMCARPGSASQRNAERHGFRIACTRIKMGSLARRGHSRGGRVSEVRQLLSILDQAYSRQSWHGTNLRGSLRRTSPTQAAWRPTPSRHNIWEIVVHAAYWKYVAWRRLTGSDRGGFPVKGSNWFPRPEDVSDEAWRADVALLDRTHKTLRDAVASLSAGELYRTPRGSKVSTFALLSGVAAHDLYHAGQIQLLKKLRGAR